MSMRSPFSIFIYIYRNVYAQRSSRPDVGLPKKEGNDRISSRLSRAYWPFQPLLHHPASASEPQPPLSLLAAYLLLLTATDWPLWRT